MCLHYHGRGLHSKGNPPILKTRVREALRSHRSVLVYTDAPVPDGGSGAVYVLLRSRRIKFVCAPAHGNPHRRTACHCPVWQCDHLRVTQRMNRQVANRLSPPLRNPT